LFIQYCIEKLNQCKNEEDIKRYDLGRDQVHIEYLIQSKDCNPVLKLALIHCIGPYYEATNQYTNRINTLNKAIYLNSRLYEIKKEGGKEWQDCIESVVNVFKHIGLCPFYYVVDEEGELKNDIDFKLDNAYCHTKLGNAFCSIGMYDDAKDQYLHSNSLLCETTKNHELVIAQNYYELAKAVYFQGDYTQAVRHIIKSENMFLNAKNKQKPAKISANIKVYSSKLTEIEHQLTLVVKLKDTIQKPMKKRKRDNAICED
tara:strand:- start:840 stop:1616 length:777 start_codon:yes stop_codon:yes gene_type:complete